MNKKKHHHLSMRRYRKTKKDIANSFSTIEHICVMLFQISIYGIYSSTFSTGMS